MLAKTPRRIQDLPDRPHIRFETRRLTTLSANSPMLPSRFISHSHHSGAELYPAHELQVDMFR